jgi:putative Mn2+ efflux pump MntP
MTFLSVLAIAVALATDACAVSLAIGAAGRSISCVQTARVSGTFGFFQGGMPIVGWLSGNALLDLIGPFDHWIALVILVAIGTRMIISAFRGEPSFRSDPTSGFLLLALAIATSIDALAVGFSLAMARVSVWFPAVIIVAVTAALSGLALRIGYRAGLRWGRWTQIAGGAILCVIGLRILLEHMGGGF